VRTLIVFVAIVVGLLVAISVSLALVSYSAVLPGVLGVLIGGLVAGLLAPDAGMWAGLAVAVLSIGLIEIGLHAIMEGVSIGPPVSVPLISSRKLVAYTLMVGAATAMAKFGSVLRQGVRTRGKGCD